MLFCLVRPSYAEQVAEFVDRAVNIAVDLKKKYPKLKEFREAMAKEVRGALGSSEGLEDHPTPQCACGMNAGL